MLMRVSAQSMVASCKENPKIEETMFLLFKNAEPMTWKDDENIKQESKTSKEDQHKQDNWDNQDNQDN